MHARTPSSQPEGILHTLLSILFLVAVVLGLTWGLRTFVFQAYEIPSGSMETTIMPGNMVLSEKLTYYGREPEPGDIVTFEDPDPEHAGRILIKRVIATEGQTVDLRDGRLYVDGVLQDEPYTNGKISEPLHSYLFDEITYPYTVPPGGLWVMGDNRTNSQDTRYFGAIPASSVTGKGVFIYWPLFDIRLL